MAKKLPKGNWMRNLPNSTDTCFINSCHHFVPEDFEYYPPEWLIPYLDMSKLEELGWDPPLEYKELWCHDLDINRIEYTTLRNNGEPKSSYKPDVSEKINARKEPRLERKKRKAELTLECHGMRLKEGFNRLDKNPRPKFNYGMNE